MTLSLDDITRAVARHAPARFPDLGRPAAVLVPLYERQGRVEILLTKRTTTLPSHAGQISFPGGKRDPDDRDLVQTALREAQEEVGLQPSDVRTVGVLDDTPTFVSNFVISPVVGVIPPDYPFQPNASEIDTLIRLPLASFLDPGVLRETQTEWDGLKYTLHFYDVGGHTVWGATARILNQLFSLLGVGHGR